MPKEPGAKVITGSVAAGGSLRVRVAAIGDQTALSGIMRMVEAAQASASRAQALADRAAALLFYVAVVAGTITLAFWWLQGDQEGGLIRTATVLVIACPHALGEGREYVFCGKGCLLEFRDDPGRFLDREYQPEM